MHADTCAFTDHDCDCTFLFFLLYVRVKRKRMMHHSNKLTFLEAELVLFNLAPTFSGSCCSPEESAMADKGKDVNYT